MSTPSPSLSQQNAQRNLDGFFSFLGITAAVVPVLLCIAYATRRRREDILLTPESGATLGLRPTSVTNQILSPLADLANKNVSRNDSFS